MRDNSYDVEEARRYALESVQEARRYALEEVREARSVALYFKWKAFLLGTAIGFLAGLLTAIFLRG